MIMQRVGRNDPCPCGSGKKYKQCCGLQCGQAEKSDTVNASIPKAIQVAVEHHQAGRMAQAEAIYRQILQVVPSHPDALHLLGLLAHQVGKNEIAVELISKAISVGASSQMLFNLGGVLRVQGKLDAAIDSYQKALLLKPDYVEAHCNLGVTLQEQGKLKEAIESCQSALSLKPDYAKAHFNLGLVLQDQGKLDEAIESYRKAFTFKPDYAEAFSNMGIVLQGQGKLDEAIESYRQALALKPDYAEAHGNMGNALKSQGKLDAAIDSYRKALALNPDLPEIYINMGAAFQAKGRFDTAVENYRKALALKPIYAEAYNNLGLALFEQSKPDVAAESYRRAISIKPDYADAYSNLGLVLHKQGEACAAIESYHRAISIKPDYVDAHCNLGRVLQEQGEVFAAIERFRKALALNPDYAAAYSNLLFTLNYHPDQSAEEIYRAYLEYDKQQCAPLRSMWRAHSNDRNPNRRLRIGYVSPDFCNHACKSFLEPLLAHHDKTQVEVHAYAELIKEDDLTARYQSYVEHWIPTKGMSDEALAERIRSDGIDILVELAGHTAGNRLLTFARKPAPVSLSWLGYGYTTGLGAIDYYLTDEACVPMGSEGLFAEHPWRIATPAYTYRPAAGMGEVNSLPAQQRGYITFGTLTRSVRINHRTTRVWSEILKAVPGSRLVIDSSSFKDSAMQERLAAQFAQHGISRDRLEMGFHSPPWDTLRGIDIGLDCFPHNSGTTLFETLYMGVPYITLAGRPSVGRLGSSILQGIGHSEWIADSEDDYVAKAVELASDVICLSKTRSTLRNQMEKSPLRDEEGFARRVEDAYRGMWKTWCETGDNRI